MNLLPPLITHRGAANGANVSIPVEMITARSAGTLEGVVGVGEASTNVIVLCGEIAMCRLIINIEIESN